MNTKHFLQFKDFTRDELELARGLAEDWQFVKLAESYGHVGMKITKIEDLDAAMDEAFALKDRLVFMDIYVDSTEHVYPMQIADGSMRDMWLSKTERT